MAFTRFQVTLQRVGILCQTQPVFTFLQRVSPWLANFNHCDIQACIWMRSLTMISTSACVWQISIHMRASFSPDVWSFIPTEQGSTTVPSFFSLPAPLLLPYYFFHYFHLLWNWLQGMVPSYYSKILLSSAHLEETDRGGKTGQAMTVSRTREITTATLAISTWRFSQAPSSKITCLNNR